MFDEWSCRTDKAVAVSRNRFLGRVAVELALLPLKMNGLTTPPLSLSLHSGVSCAFSITCHFLSPCPLGCPYVQTHLIGLRYTNGSALCGFPYWEMIASFNVTLPVTTRNSFTLIYFTSWLSDFFLHHIYTRSINVRIKKPTTTTKKSTEFIKRLLNLGHQFSVYYSN